MTRIGTGRQRPDTPTTFADFAIGGDWVTRILATHGLTFGEFAKPFWPPRSTVAASMGHPAFQGPSSLEKFHALGTGNTTKNDLNGQTGRFFKGRRILQTFLATKFLLGALFFPCSGELLFRPKLGPGRPLDHAKA